MQTIRISIPNFLLLLACIFHSSTSNTVSFQPSTQFQQFKQTYNKTYSNKSEQSHRQQIFYNNLQKVIQLSTSPDSPFGITKFMDLTEEELSLMKNSKITSPVRTVTSHFTISRKLGAPAFLDWRAKGAVTAVKDQGNCGSCWAFAAAGYCQSNLIINSGYRNDIDLSQQYLLQCTPQSNCKGGYPAYALVQILTKGIPKQQTFPYSPLTKYPNICQTRKTIKVKGKQVYVYFQLNDIQLIYLLQSGPIVVGVASENWEYYRGGVMVCSSNVTEDHAVLLVGYTNQYWIVKNQWGTNWGQRGFIRISRALGSNCLMGIQVETLSTTKLTILTTILLLVVLLIY